MLISRIEVIDRRIDPEDRRDCAQVRFFAGEQITSFLAHAPRASSRLELVRDALRQLRQMPELRSGREPLIFSGLCVEN